ncbi:MAG: UDP-N-acetylglucosamine 2-epimerase (non-hydrolyzing) [Anaerovoracaceae bacterium]
MKVVTVVGARPQFIKAAVVSRVLRTQMEEVIIHTGQHYDHNMSDVFFEELEIPKPDYNLGIAGGTHGKMTGEMLIAIEEVLMKENPDVVLLYGDTNSTLAGGLAAAKLHIPVCHVEAGARLGSMVNPEEINRILTDNISDALLCCVESAVEFLKKEGKTENVYLVGDPMYDAFKYYSHRVGDKVPETLEGLEGEALSLPEDFYYLTCHREENTGEDETLLEILTAMEALDAPCIYPVHPRNKKTAIRLQKEHQFKNILFCLPVGYLMSVYLVNHGKKIVTDSGGLQREAFFAGKQCVTVFDHIVWPETMSENRNQLSKPNKGEILEKLKTPVNFDHVGAPFGDGHSAEKIVEIMKERYSK